MKGRNVPIPPIGLNFGGNYSTFDARGAAQGADVGARWGQLGRVSGLLHLA